MSWETTLRRRYMEKVTHAFLLCGNVNDFVRGTRDLRTHLSGILASREVILSYNRAEGIRFVSYRDSLPQPAAKVQKEITEKKQQGFKAEQIADHLNRVAGTQEWNAKSVTPFMLLSAAEMKTKLDEIRGVSQDVSALAGLAVGQSREMALPRDPDAAFVLIEKLLRQKKVTAAVIMEHVETVAPAGDPTGMSPGDRAAIIHLQRWSRDREIADNDHPLILITGTPSAVHPDLRSATSRVGIIDIPLPNLQERTEYIQWLLQESLAQGENLISDVDEFARLTAGLSRVHLHDMCSSARFEKVQVTRSLIKSRKKEMVANEFGDTIEIIDPEHGFEEIGGYEHVKKFFRKNVIQPLQTGNLNRVPMGVLLLGPAGTGKSRVAMAVAKESGVNCVVLNPAKIFGSYVGQSERNLEKALECIESMSPTICFIDEIDQSVQRSSSSGDSGVSARVFKRLLEFMADGSHRGRVVFLAASNRPDLLDAALKRPGRFDKKIPFLPPNAKEREAIITVLSKKFLGAALEPTATAIEKTNGWTGAELEALVIKAGELIEDKEATIGTALDNALVRYKPTTQDIELMSLLAIQEVNDLDLLPEDYRKELEDRKVLKEKVEKAKLPQPDSTSRELIAVD